MKDKITMFCDFLRDKYKSDCIQLNTAILTELNIDEKLKSLDDESSLKKFFEAISGDLMPMSKIEDYINEHYPDYGVTGTAVTNFRKYGFLKKHLIPISKKRFVIFKQSIDSIFNSNLIDLTPDDFFQALKFSIEMLEKVENYQVRFGTFFDSIARRNGTALNYIERHLVGKLGETATIKHINKILESKGSIFEVENSFNSTQVEAADIVNLRNKKNRVIVNAGKKVQIKTATGLNSVVLKEDRSKIQSATFGVDYCSFAQLLNSPLVFLVDLVSKLGKQYSGQLINSSTDFLRNINVNIGLLVITARVSGFIQTTNMTLINKGANLPPLGEITSDSYYAYISDLETDYAILAAKLVP
jgi:hypothetical protein